MKQLEAKVAEIAQGAAKIMDANGDGSITLADAKYQAAQVAGKTAAFVDRYDDMFERPYNKAMRTIKISHWPGHSLWGWLFKWPVGFITWCLLLLMLVVLFMPRPSTGPINSLSSLNRNLVAIRVSLARIEAMAPQVAVMDARSLEAMQAIAELKEFTARVEKTKLFRKSAVGKSWKNEVFGR